MLDIGLLGALSKLSPDMLSGGDEIFTHLLGTFSAELYLNDPLRQCNADLMIVSDMFLLQPDG